MLRDRKPLLPVAERRSQDLLKIAENGSKRAQSFCPECGIPIYSAPVGAGPSFFGIRVGAIKQRDQLIPKSQ